MRSLCCLVLLLLASFVQADQIVLKNGETLQGQITSQDDKEVKIVVAKKGMSLTMTIKREDITSIQKGDDLKAEFAKRSTEVEKLPSGWEKATKYLELGRWARNAGLWEESVAAFNASKGALSGYDDVADLEIARTWLAAKDHDKCKDALAKILERNPNHEQAKALANDLGTDVKEEASNDLQKGLTYYAEGNPRRALAVFENVVKSHSEDELSQMSKACEEKTGQPLSAIMIDCRFRQGCPDKCLQGWKRCPRPTCQSGKQKEFHRVVEGPTGQVINDPVTEDYCDLCKGLKYIPCEKCHGTGIYLGTPTDFEKKDLVRLLALQAQSFGSGLDKLVTESKDKNQEMSVRALDCMNMLGNARKARYLLEYLVAVAPTANIPGATGQAAKDANGKDSKDPPPLGGGDVSSQIRFIDNFVFTSIAGISSAFMTAAEMAHQESLGAPGPNSKEILTLSNRVVRAREALEAAEQARIFLLYALMDCPSSVVPMAGDMKEKLAMATQFAERCRITYKRLSDLEMKAANLNEQDLQNLMRDVEGMVPSSNNKK